MSSGEQGTTSIELTRNFMRYATISTTSDDYMHAGREVLIEGMRGAEAVGSVKPQV